MLPHIPTALNAGAHDGDGRNGRHSPSLRRDEEFQRHKYERAAESLQAQSRPHSAISGMSLSITSGATPRVNPYLQGLRPTTPLQSAAGGPRASTSVALAMAFRPLSPMLLDPVTGTVVITRFSRPQSAASDDSGWSQQPLAKARKELMNPMAVKLTPLGPVVSYCDDLEDCSGADFMCASDDEKEVREAYLDEILDDPLPFEEAEVEPVTPSEISKESESSSRSTSPGPMQQVEPEEVSSDDEYEVQESAHAKVEVAGLSIEIKKDALTVSKDLAGHVDSWQRSITHVLDQEGIVAEVEHIAAGVPGVVTVQVIFRNYAAMSEHEANTVFSVNSDAAKGKGKGWTSLRKVTNIVGKAQIGEGAPLPADAANAGGGEVDPEAARSGLLNHVNSNESSADAGFLRASSFQRMGSDGMFRRVNSSGSAGTGFVAKGATAKRLRNDCMSRSAELWNEAIPDFVQMRACQVELMMPRGAELGMVPPPDDNHWDTLKSLKLGVLVRIAEGTPPLGVLAAGARGGSGTVVSVSSGKRPKDADHGDRGRPWELSVWWHETGLVTRHASDVISAENFGRVGSFGVLEQEGGGEEGDEEKGKSSVLGTDCLQKFARAVGVHVMAEPGLMVQRRKLPPGPAWAVQSVVEEGLVVSEEVKHEYHHHHDPSERPRRMCYVVWKKDIHHHHHRHTHHQIHHKHTRSHIGIELTKLKTLAAVKVPNARLAALLRKGDDEVSVGSESCPPHIGMRVQVSRSSYTNHSEFLVLSGDGPGVVVGVKMSSHGESEQPSGAFPEKYHSLQIAWLRTSEVGTYAHWLISDKFLVQVEGERLVGSAQVPTAVGMRVRFVDSLRFLQPVIHSDSGGGPGTITWVSPWDPEGLGNSGGVCQVLWDWTGVRECYRTGYKCEYYLRLLDHTAMRNHYEVQLGADVQAHAGRNSQKSALSSIYIASLTGS